MASPNVKKMKVNNLGTQNECQQLVVPGLEDFLAKLEQNSQTNCDAQPK